jgi:hypothetical protein
MESNGILSPNESILNKRRLHKFVSKLLFSTAKRFDNSLESVLMGLRLFEKTFPGFSQRSTFDNGNDTLNGQLIFWCLSCNEKKIKWFCLLSDRQEEEEKRVSLEQWRTLQ